MKPTPVEVRVRRRQGSFRLQLGTATTKAELASLDAQRDVLLRLAKRGEWDVLQAAKARMVSPEELLRLVDQYGVEDYRLHLSLRTPAAVGAETLRARADAWLADCEKNPELRASSARLYRRHVAKLLAFEPEPGAPLGERPWHDVPRHVIRDARNGLALSPNTIRSVLGAWSAFFQWSLRREESMAEAEKRRPLVEANPVRRAEIWGRIEKTRHRFLEPREIQAFLVAAQPSMRAQYATLALAGLRIEELIYMPPSHVRLPTHLHVGKWGGWQPKVKRSVRDVPIHPALLALLEEYRDRWAGTGDAFFINPNTGERWGYRSFAEHMRRDAQTAGLRYGAWSFREDGIERHAEGITPHTLRHTFGTLLAREDVQLGKIAKLMGDTRETVEAHYLHHVPGDLEAAVKRLPLAYQLAGFSDTHPKR